MKKFMYVILSIMVCASFCLCGCSDDMSGKNEVYFVDATITHPLPTLSSYEFVFNYVYQNKEVYNRDRVCCDVWYDSEKDNDPNRIDEVWINNGYITPNTSLVISVYIEHATDIEQYKTLTIQYYVCDKTDKNKTDLVLAEKTFKISDILSKATDIPYSRF